MSTRNKGGRILYQDGTCLETFLAENCPSRVTEYSKRIHRVTYHDVIWNAPISAWRHLTLTAIFWLIKFTYLFIYIFGCFSCSPSIFWVMVLNPAAPRTFKNYPDHVIINERFFVDRWNHILATRCHVTADDVKCRWTAEWRHYYGWRQM